MLYFYYSNSKVFCVTGSSLPLTSEKEKAEQSISDLVVQYSCVWISAITKWNEGSELTELAQLSDRIEFL